jgi:hypothetical protein
MLFTPKAFAAAWNKLMSELKAKRSGSDYFNQ